MATKVFEDRIAGHEGILTNDDGIIMKPLNQKEHRFYQQCPPHLKPFLPNFYGTLKKATPQQIELLSAEGATNLTDGQGGDEKEYLCLENIILNYAQPNILDVKLGFKLYDDECNDEKRERMVQKALNTTTKHLGVRVCGFKAYDYDKSSSIKSDQQECRDLTPDTIKDVFHQFVPSSMSAQLRKLVLDGIIGEIEDLKSELEATEACFRSASLLIVFESNLDKLQSLFDKQAENQEEDCYPVDVRLIDFAHSHFEIGIGPDKDFILSLDNLIELFKPLY